MPQFSPDRLYAIGTAVLRRMGSSPEEAHLVVDHLVRANLAGHDSHGIGLLPGYVRQWRAGRLKPNQTLETVLDFGAVLMFDGGRGFGQRMAYEAVAHGIARAKQLGACVLGLRNSSHIARVGTYGEQCAAEGCAFIAFVNVADHQPYQAPYGGRDARLGTNPFCAAVPGPDGPTLILDTATTTIAFGKARVAHEKGVKVPEGALVDADGHFTTDPAAMVTRHEGALTSFGLHKGSGLAVLCEAMGAVLTGGKRADEEQAGGVLNSMLAVIIDTKRLEGLGDLQAGFAAVAANVKASRPAAGFNEVLLPGEPERRSRAERSARGVPIAEA
ncbi:MAG: malate/lactate/ureidoglycolate dehydrogenase, partial [Acetobacteraceae bacterium]|nr:malate/lactate/ureidoglycolate dehydrogenase [Acetobacteraceae bacterium]